MSKKRCNGVGVIPFAAGVAPRFAASWLAVLRAATPTAQRDGRSKSKRPTGATARQAFLASQFKCLTGSAQPVKCWQQGSDAGPRASSQFAWNGSDRLPVLSGSEVADACGADAHVALAVGPEEA